MKEKNLRRNLHSMASKSGLQLNVDISYLKCPVQEVRGAKIMKRTVLWPVIHFSQWLECALQCNPKLVLAGKSLDDISAWQSIFESFWMRYEEVDPTHPIYSMVEVGNRRFYIPLSVHGDEGRGKNKTPVLIESFSPIISYKGPDYTNLSGHLD